MVLDAFLLGATGFAAVQYSTNAEAFLQAVRQARAPLSACGMLPCSAAGQVLLYLFFIAVVAALKLWTLTVLLRASVQLGGWIGLL